MRPKSISIYRSEHSRMQQNASDWKREVESCASDLVRKYEAIDVTVVYSRHNRLAFIHLHF